MPDGGDSYNDNESLSADREQITTFVTNLFRYADVGTFASFRAFYDRKDGVFDIRSVEVGENGLDAIVDAAVLLANRCANARDAVVFAPPVATFSNPKSARERDLANGLALSVECDHAPHAARRRLESLLGPATFVVASGGEWVDPQSGKIEPKLHLHWRLTEPTRERAAHNQLKEARQYATVLVGGDPTNVPTVHPIRWPGSWHKKGEPRLARAISITDSEIDLTFALPVLQEAAQVAGVTLNTPSKNAVAALGDGRDTAEIVKQILTGENYHSSIVTLSMRYLRGGMAPHQAKTTIRGLMHASRVLLDIPIDNWRWAARFNDVDRAVDSAARKIEADQNPRKSRIITISELLEKEYKPIQWIVPNYLTEGLIILAGHPKIGKSWLAFDWALAVSGDRRAMGTVDCETGDVLYLALEDSERRLRGRLDTLKVRPNSRCHLVSDWPRIGRGGIQRIEQWLDKHLGARLVIIDVWGKFRGEVSGKNAYMDDARAIEPLHNLAKQRGIAVVVVHHTNKAVPGPDWFDKISGTTGLTGAADGVILLRRDRGGDEGELLGVGRDMQDYEVPMVFDNGTWQIVYRPKPATMAQQVLTILSNMAPAGMLKSQIVAKLGWPVADVTAALNELRKRDSVRQLPGNQWALNDE